MEDAYRIVHRVICFEKDGTEDDESETYSTLLWSGTDLPTYEEEIRAHIASVELSQSPPEAPTDFPCVVHEGIVLQQRREEKVGSRLVKIAWEDYPEERDNEYHGWAWSIEDSNASR